MIPVRWTCSIPARAPATRATARGQGRAPSSRSTCARVRPRTNSMARIELAALPEEAVDGSDGRMVDTGKDLRLGAEALDDLRLAREIRADGLDRHLALQHDVDRPPDGPHPALADALDDLVVADDPADHVLAVCHGLSGSPYLLSIRIARETLGVPSRWPTGLLDRRLSRGSRYGSVLGGSRTVGWEWGGTHRSSGSIAHSHIAEDVIESKSFEQDPATGQSFGHGILEWVASDSLQPQLHAPRLVVRTIPVCSLPVPLSTRFTSTCPSTCSSCRSSILSGRDQDLGTNDFTVLVSLHLYHSSIDHGSVASFPADPVTLEGFVLYLHGRGPHDRRGPDTGGDELVGGSG